MTLWDDNKKIGKKLNYFFEFTGNLDELRNIVEHKRSAIYAIEMKGGVKVGYSVNVIDRIVSIYTHDLHYGHRHIGKIAISCEIKDLRNAENQLHDMLADKKISSELFSCTIDDVSKLLPEIRSVRNLTNFEKDLIKRKKTEARKIINNYKRLLKSKSTLKLIKMEDLY